MNLNSNSTMSYDDSAPPPSVGRRSPGGFVAVPPDAPRPPPPGANPELWDWFDRVDEDQSDYINASELQAALMNGDLTPFNLNTINLLMNIFDKNKDDQISFNEFTDLWNCIKAWQGVFARFDRDRSGTIDDTELQSALTYFGYTVTPKLLNILRRKYDVRPSANSANQGTPPGITFDRFVRACVVLFEVDKAFKDLDTDQDGWATIDYLQLLQTVLSLP